MVVSLNEDKSKEERRGSSATTYKKTTVYAKCQGRTAKPYAKTCVES